MAKLAIKGHATCDKEAIEILEMLGANNTYLLNGNEDCAYYVNECGEIRIGDIIFGNEPYIIFTLEEFLEKFPYKLGDKVIYEDKRREITKMVWEEQTNTVAYKLDNKLYCNVVNELQPYKEEAMLERIVDITRESDGRYRLKVNNQFDIVADEGEYYLVRRKPKYPKTYEECCELLSLGEDGRLYTKGYNSSLIQDFQKLLVCRDAYWKIAGEQMGLGKPWEPDWGVESKIKYVILYRNNNITKDTIICKNYVLAFPSTEMRDAFYENFKDLIEKCKEFL